MMRRTGVVLVSALVVVGVSAASGCSGEQRSAAGPSADPSSSVALSSASAGVVAADGVPGMPRLSWKAAGHVVTLSLRPAPGSVPVDGYEIAVGPQGGAADMSKVQSCAAVAGSTDTTACPVTLKRGGWDVYVRAVNQDGTSDWLQGPSVSVYRCTDADAAAGVCEEFDTGPGGGFVFYDAGSRQSWGQYLEAAPKGWSGKTDDPQMRWCSVGWPGNDVSLATGTGIGSGAANTQLLIENCSPNSAAGVAAAYRGGGKSDWFLPSKDELDKMHDRRSEVGGLADAYYLSSSWKKVEDVGTVWAVCFSDNLDQIGCEGSVWQPVRPIRAF